MTSVFSQACVKSVVGRARAPCSMLSTTATALVVLPSPAVPCERCSHSLHLLQAQLHGVKGEVYAGRQSPAALLVLPFVTPFPTLRPLPQSEECMERTATTINALACKQSPKILLLTGGWLGGWVAGGLAG